ncbi:MAG: hypothetical protein K8R21_13470 [Leptospira sp.]|nr:hypothetical protein [Leptospira sp.]
MPKIISVGTASAEFKTPQTVVKGFVQKKFANRNKDINRLIGAFDNSSIDTRYFVCPMEWFESPHSFSEVNAIYVEKSVDLAVKAISNCINDKGFDISDFQKIIFVSSTGLSTPSLDALIINKLNLDRHIRRTPVWGLGCLGGAASISQAMEYTKAYPEDAVLIVAVELCSLTFQQNDFSKSNVIATALFSDGAASVLVAGEKNKHYDKPGLKCIDTLSTIYHNSLDVMGWEVEDSGLRVIFKKDIPMIVRDLVKPNIMEFTGANDKALGDILHFVAHPGGLKVINSYEEALDLKSGSLNHSRKMLAEHGNMSSASVLYVLNDFLYNGKYSPGDFGLITALGPGFSSELVLFQAA